MSNVTKEALLERAFQAEAKKAQTKLNNLRRRASKARDAVIQAWAEREASFVVTLPEEVVVILKAAGSL